MVACLACSGCVGFGWVGPTRAAFENPQDLTQDRGSFSSGAGRAPLKSETLELYWGAPDSVDQFDNGSERWTYTFGLRWAGVVLVPFIPIPLLLPVGQDWVSFDIEDGNVVFAHAKRNTTRLYAHFGFYVQICGAGFGPMVESEPGLITRGSFYTY